jgi:homoserine kinase type II
MPATDRAAAEALSLYADAFCHATAFPIGNRGGFSGAALWRVEAGGQAFCLRAWPPGRCDAARLDFIHRVMRHARAAGLPFVPAVIAAADGRDHVKHADRLWELTEWLPGRADFLERPSPKRFQAAGTALARLHAAWERLAGAASGVCPALSRRLAAAVEWQSLRRAGWHPRWGAGEPDPVRPVAQRAWQLIDRRVDAVAERLRPWSARHWRLQPCHCDVWHGNLLFEGDDLTGLVDYGAAKVDHPAVDVARLFGSLAPDDAGAWQTGLRAYRAVRGLSEEEATFALALDETGAVIGVATWLRWLYEEFRPFRDRSAVAARLGILVSRLE